MSNTNWKVIGTNSGNMSRHRNVNAGKLNYEDGKWKSIYDASGNKTLIVVTHRHNSVFNCDKVYLLDEGKIIDQGKYIVFTGKGYSDKEDIDSIVSNFSSNDYLNLCGKLDLLNYGKTNSCEYQKKSSNLIT